MEINEKQAKLILEMADSVAYHDTLLYDQTFVEQGVEQLLHDILGTFPNLKPGKFLQGELK